LTGRLEGSYKGYTMTNNQAQKLLKRSPKLQYQIQEYDEAVDGHWKTVEAHDEDITSEDDLKRQIKYLQDDRPIAMKYRVLLVESRQIEIELA